MKTKKIVVTKVHESNHKVYVKSQNKRNYRRHTSKADTRYRILENTMRGYFNYSI